MEDQKPTSFTFEIDNFSEKETIIRSPNFSSGGCEWYVKVHPKGHRIDDHLSVYLGVANPKSLPLGWKRRSDYSILLLNQSGKELFRQSAVNSLFCEQFPATGRTKAVPLKNLQEKGFLENNKLIVKAEVKVVEVVNEGDATGNELYDVSGFQVLYSQVVSVGRLFTDHPDIALNVRSKNQLVKTTYINILLGLIETLDKPAHSITELEKAHSELMELTEAGFKLEWLKEKIEDITLGRKKAITDDSRIRQLEEHVKNINVELDNEKGKLTTSNAKVLSLEKKVSDLNVELDNEKGKSTTLDAKVLSLENKAITDDSRVQQLEEHVKKLKAELDNEKVKFTTSDAKVLLLEEKAITNDSRVRELEEHVKNLKAELDNEKVLSLEKKVSDLRVELENEKVKSTISGAKVSSLEEEVSNLKTNLDKNKKKKWFGTGTGTGT